MLSMAMNQHLTWGQLDMGDTKTATLPPPLHVTTKVANISHRWLEWEGVQYPSTTLPCVNLTQHEPRSFVQSWGGRPPNSGNCLEIYVTSFVLPEFWAIKLCYLLFSSSIYTHVCAYVQFHREDVIEGQASRCFNVSMLTSLNLFSGCTVYPNRHYPYYV